MEPMLLFSCIGLSCAYYILKKGGVAMIKKIAKIVTGLFVGVVLVMGITKTAKADVVYSQLGGKVWAIDNETGFFVELPAGVIVPGLCGNMVVVEDEKTSTFSLQYSPYAYGMSAEQYLQLNYNMHVANFQAAYGAYGCWAPTYCIPQCDYVPYYYAPYNYNYVNFINAFNNVDWSQFPVK